MVYCAVVGCYNHSNKKNTTEKISYFRLPSDESLRGTWLSKIKREDLPANYDSLRVCHVHSGEVFVFVMYILKQISFNAIYRYVFFLSGH